MLEDQETLEIQGDKEKPLQKSQQGPLQNCNFKRTGWPPLSTVGTCISFVSFADGVWPLEALESEWGW